MAKERFEVIFRNRSGLKDEGKGYSYKVKSSLMKKTKNHSCPLLNSFLNVFRKFIRQQGIYSIFVTIFLCSFVIPALEF